MHQIPSMQSNIFGIGSDVKHFGTTFLDCLRNLYLEVGKYKYFIWKIPFLLHLFYIYFTFYALL